MEFRSFAAGETHRLPQQHVIDLLDGHRPKTLAERAGDPFRLILEGGRGDTDFLEAGDGQGGGLARLHLQDAAAVRASEQLGTEHRDGVEREQRKGRFAHLGASSRSRRPCIELTAGATFLFSNPRSRPVRRRRERGTARRRRSCPSPARARGSRSPARPRTGGARTSRGGRPRTAAGASGGWVRRSAR